MYPPAPSLTPGFMVVHGNHPESLRELMIAWMARHPLAPLEDERILVQSNGVAQWLKLSLAQGAAEGGIGIAAGLRVELPARALWDIYRAVLGDATPQASAFDKSLLVWRLMRLLPSLLHEDVFAPLARFLQDDADLRKLHQLAARLADLFDQYQVYRADWLAAWGAGHDTLPRAGGKPADDVPDVLRWQPRLWRALLADVGEEGAATSRADVHRRFLERARELPANECPEGLARRITVFGISSLPRQTIEALAAAARWSQVLLCVHNPCEHDWSHIVAQQDAYRSARHRTRSRSAAASPEALHLQAHPLLAAWGKQGRDFIRLLDEFDEHETYEARFKAIGRHIAVFAPNERDTLLRQLQDDIRDLRPIDETKAEWKPVDPRLDSSIAFHVAHGPQREVEALHDQLLRAFTQDRTLRPRDVIVMVPDVSTYAPHIQAVFGLVDRDDPRYIPFHVADQKQRRQDPLLAALEALLRLPLSRLGVSEALDLLDVPAVRRRFDIADHQLATLQQWAGAAGIRWGLHEEHRASLGLAEAGEQNSWRFGLRRMLLGYAAGRGAAWHGIEPLAEVGGLDAELLGPLARFVDALDAHWRALQEAAIPADWVERLAAMLEDFFLAADGSAEALTLLRAGSALQEWLQACDEASFAQPLPLAVVREHWLDTLEPSSLRQPFFGGGVTFASLMPMRAIPFRWVALLGMNDGDYPRSRPAMDFDLMAREHRAGDRSRREDDRYLFLEALLSAREHLHVSWVGRSIRDNEERPPSVLVAQLRDHIASGWRHAGEGGGRALVNALTVTHRLQPFHPAYFETGSSHFSYANEWRATLDASDERAAGSGEALAHRDEQGPVTLAELAGFLKHPVKHFFTRRLDIHFDDKDDGVRDDEPFTVDPLENWQLQDELIRAQRAVVDEAAQAGCVDDAVRSSALASQLDRIRARGALPHGAFAGRHAAQLAEPMDALFASYSGALLDWPIPVPDAPLDHEVDGLRLLDWLTGLRGNAAGERCRLVLESSGIVRQRQWRYDKLLPYWAAHIAGHLDGGALSTWVLSKAGIARLRPLAEEEVFSAWAALLDAYREGMNRPLRFSVACASAALAAREKKDVTRESVRDAVAKEYRSQTQPSQYGGRVDAYVTRAWPDFDAFWSDDGDDCMRWAEGLMQPLRDHLGAFADENGGAA